MLLKTYLCLGGSGLLGVTLGDTFYLKSLMEIGPKASLALTLFIPVVTVFLALIILHEQLSLISSGLIPRGLPRYDMMNG